MDNRAQAIGIVVFVVVLILASMLYSISDRAMNPVIDQAENASQNSTYQKGLGWVTTAWDNFLFGVLFVSVFGLVALAIYQRRAV